MSEFIQNKGIGTNDGKHYIINDITCNIYIFQIIPK